MNEARKHEKYEALLAACRDLPPVRTAVAHPCDEISLSAAVAGAEAKLIAPVLVGPLARMHALADSLQLDLSRLELRDAPHSHAAAAGAVALVRAGEAQALMKGSLHTDELLAEVVRKDTGLRTGRRLSHVFIMDVPAYHKPLFITDGAVNLFPSLEDKVDIVQNAIDNAINPEAASAKHIRSAVAGDADILVVPDLEAGNMLAKELSFLAGADAAGIVLGARVPIVLTSRADSILTRLASCAVAVLVAKARREGSTKVVA